MKACHLGFGRWADNLENIREAVSLVAAVAFEELWRGVPNETALWRNVIIDEVYEEDR